MEEKSYVEDIDRSIYDIRDDEKDAYKLKEGLTPEIVEQISKEKNDPVWMQNFRLQSLQIYNEMEVPDWGPSIEGLDMEHIVTYVRPNTKMKGKWSEVPKDIKDTFERLGIPQAERKSLAGVGAQYDSELVYHNVREEVAAQGVIYTDLESAMHGEYADMIQCFLDHLQQLPDHSVYDAIQKEDHIIEIVSFLEFHNSIAFWSEYSYCGVRWSCTEEAGESAAIAFPRLS